MRNLINTIKRNFNPSIRLGFLFTLVFFFWFKSIVAYFIDFHGLGINSLLQVVTALLNPIFFTAIIFFLFAFIKKTRIFYSVSMIFYLAISILLFVNVMYFREMSSFISFNVIASYQKVNQGLGSASLSFIKLHDLVYLVDVFYFGYLIIRRKFKFDKNPIQRPNLKYLLVLAITGFMGVFTASEIERPQLLVRGFDDNYMVKYMGMNFYLAQDTFNSLMRGRIRSTAKPTDLEQIREYINKHFADAIPKYNGLANGKNLIVLHLESFQQSSVNLKIDGQEVTPFINSLFNSQDSISFDNFFNQVGQGKTSDAETMLETSTFGLPTGSVFTRYYANTFQGLPAILNQTRNYSTAVFHGNNGTFWNRNIMYKSLGYQNFFDAGYYDVSGRKAQDWGLKDKLLFKDSIQYLEKLPQPFYVKYLTVTNHTPYAIDPEDKTMSQAVPETDSAIVNNYFRTNRYLDDSIREFYEYLDKVGMLKNSIIVLYGDHYGISSNENRTLAPIIGQDPTNWTDFDDAQLERVPLIINMPGSNKGYIDHTYGGEIDVLPTIEHLLGVKTNGYVQLGQDLLSDKREQLVVFRNKDFITPEYTYTGGRFYYTKTGEEIDQAKLSKKEKNKLEQLKTDAENKLAVSDKIIYGDLLRFYTPKGFKKVRPQMYDYSRDATIDRLNKNDATSIFGRNNFQTTTGSYITNAPEQNDPPTNSGRIQIQNNDSPNLDN